MLQQKILGGDVEEKALSLFYNFGWRSQRQRESSRTSSAAKGRLRPRLATRTPWETLFPKAALRETFFRLLFLAPLPAAFRRQGGGRRSKLATARLSAG